MIGGVTGCEYAKMHWPKNAAHAITSNLVAPVQSLAFLNIAISLSPRD